MNRIIPIAALFLLAMSNAMAKDCTPADAEAADLAVDSLSSWQAVSENYSHYGQCDDGSIAEGNSEAVIRLLVDKWNTLPALDALAKKNPAFGDWVLNHIDTTLDSGDLEAVARRAQKNCPDHSKQLCEKVGSAADQALEEQKDP
ncbi:MULTISPECIES: hypothetical protein [Lelliottia]|uniref:Secreted protein n=1 Tax=Lelliottia wanjuensis TaxID=3050585 RepID=A0AAP4FSE2_9ENTR|nr:MULTISPECIES: hypothetical protein [unclassified Lelliottia]MDK9362796.1 hypothetical protein [Lelliottia sp. V106_12]MDK9583303.1 hypothetical protein [Lelliottia sp. V86_10]MDK9615186.1 hypothetical protein [Lelliottia sp. V106_9]